MISVTLAFIHLRRKNAVNNNEFAFYMIDINPAPVMRHHPTSVWMDLP